MLDQNASNEVMRRRHLSGLPPIYEARYLFNTPGAGTSNPPVANRVAIFMAGTQPMQHSSTAAALISGSAAATAAEAGGPARPLAQVLSGLLDALATLLTTEVNPDNQDRHNTKVVKLRD
jgi:hypothetical protein